MIAGSRFRRPGDPGRGIGRHLSTPVARLKEGCDDDPRAEVPAAGAVETQALIERNRSQPGMKLVPRDRSCPRRLSGGNADADAYQHGFPRRTWSSAVRRLLPRISEDPHGEGTLCGKPREDHPSKTHPWRRSFPGAHGPIPSKGSYPKPRPLLLSSGSAPPIRTAWGPCPRSASKALRISQST